MMYLFLPVELSRISSDNSVTLILDKVSKPIRTLWAIMTCHDLEEASKSLIESEDVKKNPPILDR